MLHFRRAAPSCAVAESVQHRRCQEADDGKHGARQGDAVGPQPPRVEVVELLAERDGQEEGQEDLDAGQGDSDFLEQEVVAVAELFAIRHIVELIDVLLGVDAHVDHASRTLM